MEATPRRRFWQVHLSTAIVLMFIASLLVGVGAWYWKQQWLGVTHELERFETADPIMDAKTAIASGDLRFVGTVEKFGVEMPCIGHELAYKYGHRALVGTSEHIQSSKQGWLQKKAQNNAEQYNQVILSEVLRLEARKP